MSLQNHNKPTEDISYLPISQHEDRTNLYQHLVNMTDIKIGLLNKEIQRQERLKKHYQLNMEAHRFYIAKIKE